jgi:GntR family transcriptional repressor for pyruvate dehydrogenase complex
MSGPLTFERVGRTPRLSETIAEQLLDAMMSGRLRAGDALPSERELGEQFGVSRTVIREAVRTLATRGVVEVHSGRGVRVIAPDASSVADAMSLLLRSESAIDFAAVHEVRMMLEIHIAAKAAERSTAQDHEELRELMAAWEGAGDVDAASLLDVDFHRAIAKCARNPLYLVLLDSIAGALLENRRATLALEHSHAKVRREHQAVLDGVERHDAEGAARAMQDHLAGAEQAWRSTERRKPARDGV